MNIVTVLLVLLGIGLLFLALNNIPGLPAWVKQIAIVLVLIFAALWVFGLAGVSPVIHIGSR